MPSANLRLDLRDLAVTALDSCGHSQSLGPYLLENAAVRVQLRLSASEILPTLDDDIDEFRTLGHPYAGILIALSAEPRRVFLAHVPTRLVLKPVMRAREDRSALVPY